MKDNYSFSFDSTLIDEAIKNNSERRYKKDNSIFTFINDKIKKQEKYFVKITNKNNEHNQKYIGALTESFKKELFGYSLFNQGDEYLGEIHEEKKEGFGIYIFNLKEKNKQDIYIGFFKNNTMNGEGIYINIIDNIKDLLEYICYIGTFENGLFKKGKVYVLKNDFEKLYFQNEEKDENNNFVIERKNDIILVYKGVIKNDKLYEGIMINTNIKDINAIENKFYFKEKENSEYIFENVNDEKKEKEIIEELNKYKHFTEYNKIIKKTIGKIKLTIDLFNRNLDYCQNVIETNFKKNIIDENSEKILFA